jgi:malonate-semialdehyde dehydrogenase (acetylating) / methylmalonate-semialdehyde dehydrogenase
MRRFVSRGVATSAGRTTATASTRSPLFTTVSVAPSSSSQAVSSRRIHATAQHLQASAALASTATNFPKNHEKIQNVEDTPYFVDNKFVPSSTNKYIDLYDPATNNLVTRVPQMTDAELKAAVESAEKAFPAWKAMSVLARQQIMFRFVALIRENWDRLAASITLEQGKTFADAKGDVLRGLQVAEAACGAPELLKGEVLEVAKDMETRTYREPLGVVAAICPFSKWLPMKGVLISQMPYADSSYRLPRDDSIVVYSNCNRDWQYLDS